MSAFRFLALLALLTLSFAAVACGAVSQDSTSGGVPTAASATPAPPAQEPPTSSAAPVDAGANAGPRAEEPTTKAAAPAEAIQSACDITPGQTEGPYYFNGGQIRCDITEGKPGAPLLVELQLVVSQLWNQKGKGGEVWIGRLGF